MASSHATLLAFKRTRGSGRLVLLTNQQVKFKFRRVHGVKTAYVNEGLVSGITVFCKVQTNEDGPLDEQAGPRLQAQCTSPLLLVPHAAAVQSGGKAELLEDKGVWGSARQLPREVYLTLHAKPNAVTKVATEPRPSTWDQWKASNASLVDETPR